MSESNGKKRSGCGYGCLMLAAVLVGVSALIVVGLWFIGSMASSTLDDEVVSSSLWRHRRNTGRDEFPQMEEVWSAGTGSVKVVRIPLKGMITLDSDSWNPGSTVSALRSIRRATGDSDVQGIILEIDSGGGGVTASDIIYKALVDFKASQEGRVVVAVMLNLAASGGYYVALPADCIIAHPTTITGSIGVIMQSYNVQELATKLGVHDVTIKSGENKDLLNPFTTFKAEHGEILQVTVDAMHKRFTGLVAECRKLPMEVAAKLADGRIYTAQQAVDNGLIDQIGYSQDAQLKIAELLEVEGVKVYRYEDIFSFSSLFSRPLFGFDSELKQLMRKYNSESQLMYRWQW